MTFKNQKEEVIEIKLTSYGKYLLSKGKFRPTFYAFFDDDILYDSSYTGTTEEQNYSQTRILEETPRLKVQTTFTGLETEIEKQIEEARSEKKKLKDSFQTTKERHYALAAPLGKSALISDYAPSWDITLHGAEIEEKIIAIQKDHQVLPIPQMNLESLDFRTAVVDGSKLTNELTSSSTVSVTEHDEEPTAHQEYYENGNVIKIEHMDIIIEVDELHTDSLAENYDIEFFLVEEETISNNVTETLVPLSFATDYQGDKIVNGLYTDSITDVEPANIDETCVENYLQISIDKDISLDNLCRLGYRTDFTKRGHIKVTCTEPSRNRMSEIYDPIDAIPPYGDDC